MISDTSMIVETTFEKPERRTGELQAQTQAIRDKQRMEESTGVGGACRAGPSIQGSGIVHKYATGCVGWKDGREDLCGVVMSNHHLINIIGGVITANGGNTG